MLAKVTGLFRLSREVELKYANSGTAIANIGLACSEKYKDKEDKLFLDAVAFGKTAEIIHEHFKKGSQIFVSGKLHTESWTTQDNQKRSKTSLTIESFAFVGSNNSHDNHNVNNSQQGEYTPPPERQKAPQQGSLPQYDVDPDEIPF